MEKGKGMKDLNKKKKKDGVMVMQCSFRNCKGTDKGCLREACKEIEPPYLRARWVEMSRAEWEDMKAQRKKDEEAEKIVLPADQ